MLRAALLSALVASAVGAVPALAQDAQAVLQDLFSGRSVAHAPDFLTAVPENQVTALVDGLRAEIGPVLLVDLSGGRGHVQTASHRVPVRITLDAQGRIAGLFVEPAERFSHRSCSSTHRPT